MSTFAIEEAIQKEAGETFVAAATATDILDNMHGTSLVISAVVLDRILDEEGDESNELTITDEEPNTEPYVDSDGETHAIGHVIFFTLSGGIEGRTYRVFFTLTIPATVSSPVQTITAIVTVEMVRWS
jgi:hypothetical protein